MGNDLLFDLVETACGPSPAIVRVYGYLLKIVAKLLEPVSPRKVAVVSSS